MSAADRHVAASPAHRARTSRAARWIALGAVAAALALGAHEDRAAAAGPSFSPKPVYSASGLALVVFPGGTLDQLEAAQREVGAIGAWVQDARGDFQVLPVGAPAFYRRRLAELFPAAGTGAANIDHLVSVTLVAPD